MEEKLWKIGELAKATGLTVRTLHHYDEIGLLTPSERTQAGYRLYGEQDVERLYEIRALRDLGIPLGEIPDALGGDVRLTLTRHLERIEQTLERERRSSCSSRTSSAAATSARRGRTTWRPFKP